MQLQNADFKTIYFIASIFYVNVSVTSFEEWKFSLGSI